MRGGGVYKINVLVFIPATVAHTCLICLGNRRWREDLVHRCPRSEYRNHWNGIVDINYSLPQFLISLALGQSRLFLLAVSIKRNSVGLTHGALLWQLASLEVSAHDPSSAEAERDSGQKTVGCFRAE